MALPAFRMKNRRIAVVDDSKAVRDSLFVLLCARGFAVDTYAGGDDLLSAIEIAGYACFVIDLKLDGMEGPDLLRAIRLRGFDQPAVLISGWDVGALDAIAVQSGFSGFVRKPMMTTSIAHLLEELLGGP